MTLLQKLVPVGHPNRPGTKLERIRAIVFHYTANDAPTATDMANAAYFGRTWAKLRDGSPGEGIPGMPTVDKHGNPVPFRYGSAQIIADMDSVTVAIPTDEVAWGCGDRPMPYTELNKGQQPAARIWFGNRQNYQTVSVEICNNDAVKNSLADWDGAVMNAKEWAISFLKSKGLHVNVQCSLNPNVMGTLAANEILLLRHFDVTGKLCPEPFVSDPAAWASLVKSIAEATK